MKLKPLLFSLLATLLGHQITPMENAHNLNKAFLNAIYGDKLEEAEQLLKDGANVDIKDRGCSALFFAASRGRINACKLLIKYGANPNLNVNNEPIWQVAARCHNSNVATLKFLLEDHILKESKCGYSKSIVTFLCCLKQKKSESNTLAITLYNQAHTLLRPYCTFNLRRCTNGINQKDCYGITALMVAAFNLELETCRFLIEHGADVNIHNDNNQTALSITRNKQKHFRSRLGKDRSAPSSLTTGNDICELLLANGAILDRED